MSFSGCHNFNVTVEVWIRNLDDCFVGQRRMHVGAVM